MSHDAEIEILVNRLLDGTGDAENRLSAQGYAHAHEILFGVREVLLDLKRTLAGIAEIPHAPDASAIIDRVRDVSADLLYGVVPHISSHLNDVIDLIDAHDDGGSERSGETDLNTEPLR